MLVCGQVFCFFNLYKISDAQQQHIFFSAQHIVMIRTAVWYQCIDFPAHFLRNALFSGNFVLLLNLAYF